MNHRNQLSRSLNKRKRMFMFSQLRREVAKKGPESEPSKTQESAR